jgi:hypothetical protein
MVSKRQLLFCSFESQFIVTSTWTLALRLVVAVVEHDTRCKKTL